MKTKEHLPNARNKALVIRLIYRLQSSQRGKTTQKCTHKRWYGVTELVMFSLDPLKHIFMINFDAAHKREREKEMKLNWWVMVMMMMIPRRDDRFGLACAVMLQTVSSMKSFRRYIQKITKSSQTKSTETTKLEWKERKRQKKCLPVCNVANSSLRLFFWG